MSVVIAIALLAAAALIAILAWDSHRQANRRRQRLDDRRDAAVAAELWRLLNEQEDRRVTELASALRFERDDGFAWCGICCDGAHPCSCPFPDRRAWFASNWPTRSEVA